MTADSFTTRRRILKAIGASALLTAGHSMAQAGFPSRPVRMVVAYSPGGVADTVARILGEPLAVLLGQPVVIENKVGGAAVIAANYVAKSPPDGHTIFFTPQAAVIQNKVLFSKLPYDPETDLKLLCTYGRITTGIVLRSGLGVSTMNDLIALARKRPVSMGAAGNGTIGHVVLESLNKEYGTKLQFVAYKGEAPLLNDLLGEHVDAGAITMAYAKPHLDSGALRPAAVLGRSRSDVFPQVPSLSELGGKSLAFGLTSWQSLSVPAGTPRPIIDRLASDIQKALAQDAVRRRIRDSGVEVEYIGPDELLGIYRSDLKVWTRMLTELGLKGSAG